MSNNASLPRKMMTDKEAFELEFPNGDEEEAMKDHSIGLAIFVRCEQNHVTTTYTRFHNEVLCLRCVIGRNVCVGETGDRRVQNADSSAMCHPRV